MWLPLALLIAVLGTFSSRFRHAVGGIVYWPCLAVLLLTLYGMTLP